MNRIDLALAVERELQDEHGCLNCTVPEHLCPDVVACNRRALTLHATVTRPHGTLVVALREQGSAVDFARFNVLIRAGGRGSVDVYAEGFGTWFTARSRKSVPVTIASWLQDKFSHLNIQCIFPIDQSVWN